MRFNERHINSDARCQGRGAVQICVDPDQQAIKPLPPSMLSRGKRAVAECSG
jgi:hypothetical protein